MGIAREYYTHYSSNLNRDMHVLIHGYGGQPFIVFPCQDSMCTNWEDFGMLDTLKDYLENGKIQLFVVDTVDKESWSDTYGDKQSRAHMQERYYRYICDELQPFVTFKNKSGKLPMVTGFSLGATHAIIFMLRRPDLFGGCLSLSGCYDVSYFFGGYYNDVLYNNAPLAFLPNMPKDHHYINLYNQRKIAVCVGQGAWEDEGVRTTGLLKELFVQKGINAWVDFWGYDVNHDWPWWKQQIRYFMPWLLGER